MLTIHMTFYQVIYWMMLLNAVIGYKPYLRFRSIINLTTIRAYISDTPDVTTTAHSPLSTQANNIIDYNDPEIKKNQLIIEKYFPNCEIPNATMIEVIEKRQIASRTPFVVANEKHGCKYGFTQAFLRQPVSGRDNHNELGKLQSGMVRLSCPHLVKEIDTFEEEGGIDQINLILNGTKSRMASSASTVIATTDLPSTSPTPLLTDSVISDASKTDAKVDNSSNTSFNSNDEQIKFINNFKNTNRIWKDIRNDLMTDDDKSFVKEYLGNKAGDIFINCGIIGISQNKYDDAKCLHAHVADELLRGDNDIGKWTLAQLEKRGVNTSGCESCWQQCDLKHTKTETSWWYTSNKNKQGLRTNRAQVRKLKEQGMYIKPPRMSPFRSKKDKQLAAIISATSTVNMPTDSSAL